MELNRRVKKAVTILLLGGAFFFTMQAAFVYLDLTFTSDKARKVLLQQIKNVTQRDARIDGDVLITISLLPQLLVERVHVLNADGFGKEDLLTISKVHVRISLLSLLAGNLHLEELSADHARVNLINNKSGDHNWSFDHLVPTQLEPLGGDESAAKTGDRRRISIKVFELTDITISYSDQAAGTEMVKHLSRLSIDLEDTEKPYATIAGTLQDYPYDIAFEFEPLDKFSKREAWKMIGLGTFAARNTRIDTVVHVNKQQITGELKFDVEDINLGALLDHLGIVSGADAASDKLRLKASYQGEDLSKIFETTVFELQLERGYYRWKARLNGQLRELEFDKAIFRAAMDTPVKVHLDGKLFEEVIKLDLSTNPLSEFIDGTNQLDIDLTAHVAGGDVSLKGALDLPVKTRLFRLDISIKGRDLEKLNEILASELPPFNNYSLSGSISSTHKGYVVKADNAMIGDTQFKASIIVDTSAFKPFWTINLHSKQLQIRDFEFADEKMSSLKAGKLKDSLGSTGTDAGKEPGFRLKQIVNDPVAHFDINVNADRVLAGESALGGFRLGVKLRDKTLVLHDAELDIPGGHIKAAASFKIEDEFITGSLRFDADEFDSAVIVDYFTAGVRQGGLISARADLQLGGREFGRLFDHATGKLDVAFWPKNFRTSLFNLWATNLFLLILPEIKKDDSRVNCVVALMDLEDGIMTEDFLALDTTSVWMHGNINVDFADERVILSLYPRSKTARLFAVQVPIRAEGSWHDMHLISNPVDITAAYLSFITSPLHVPARWVFGDKMPEDASAVCEKLYDREFVKQLKAKIEAEEQKEIEDWLDSD